jgi:large subunit ribosomal protein L25
MANESTRLNATAREIEGSRANRRLRREGRVPAVLYGGGEDPTPLSVDARELRQALHGAGAVLEIAVDGQTSNAVVKDTQLHPVRNEALHVDFVRVRMDVAIQSVVTLELVGAEDSPGTTEGGVLEQQLREVNIEALPGDIPESIVHDVSSLELGGTVHVSDLSAPGAVTILDDGELVVASMTLPRLEVETEEAVETETEVVGEGEGEAAAVEGDEGTPDDGAAEGAETPDTTSE